MSKWSWGNQLLVYIQNTTDARGRKMWLKAGRTIIKDGGKSRKPIGILAPVMIKIPKKDTIERNKNQRLFGIFAKFPHFLSRPF